MTGRGWTREKLPNQTRFSAAAFGLSKTCFLAGSGLQEEVQQESFLSAEHSALAAALGVTLAELFLVLLSLISPA